MKKIYFLFIGLLLLSFQFICAQAPQKMSYQMVIRDASNQLIANTNVGVKISILQNASNGISVFEEAHTITTNSNGLASLVIGNGAPLLNAFSSINWASAEHFVKTEVDPLGGTNYTIVATNQLLSVPYALHANSANTTKIQDADANTKVEAEKNANENKIRFTLNGAEYFVMNRGTLEVINTGGATYIGREAGINENYESASNNVGIGKQALKASVNGFNNVAVGSRALWSNAGGNDNVAVGTDALRSNDQVANTAVGTLAGAENNGNGNVFIGNGAGQNELGNDKLYISNSNTSTPLIKGDFAAKKITINDNLEAKNIQLTNGATNGYVLQSDANGNATWVNPNTIPSNFTELDPKVATTSTNIVSKWNGTSLVDSQISDNGTNIGIGTPTPTQKLDVAGNIKANGGLIIDTDGLNNSNGVNMLRFGSANSGEGIGSSRQITNNNRGLDLYTNNEPRVSVANWGGVGIGTLFPANKLDVNGNLAIGSNYVENQSAPTNGAIIEGAVGIGTTNPTAKLHVNGNIKGTLITANALQLIDGGIAGYVLQSDATGYGIWTNPSSINTATKTLISDADANTKVEVEKTPNDNKIVFTQDGTEYHKMNKATLEFNNSRSNIYIGNASGLNDPLTITADNIGLGANSLQNIDTGTANVAIGKRAMQSTIVGGHNVALGFESMKNKQNGAENVAIGTQAGYNNLTGSRNTFLGMSTGSFNNGSGNVFIGYGAGFDETGDDKLIIKNTGLTSVKPLIEGDFSTKNVKINDTLTVKNIVITEGAAEGYVLKSDINGNASWINSTSLNQKKIQDADNNTAIHVEKNANEDIIRFETNGIERFVINGKKLEPKNNGNSVFLGEGAGANDNLIENENTFIGFNAGLTNISGFNNVALGAYSLNNNINGESNTSTGYNAMLSNTSGSYNVANGSSALKSLTTGSFNTAIGEGALSALTTGQNNIAIGNAAGYTLTNGNNNTFLGQGTGVQTIGSGNVFIGKSAGSLEVGSNKLYIDNSSTDEPLIYGDFTSNLVKIHGALNINNAYNLPLNPGNANQVLRTNGDGSTSWGTPTIIETDPQVSTSIAGQIPKWNGTTLVDGQIYDNGTSLGIGTTAPIQAKLVVSGFNSYSVGNFGQFKNDGTGSTNSTGTPYAYSIYASNRIAASEFNAFSDARIKNIKGISNNKQDLETLSKIEITNYTLKDSISKGNNNYKKVIAQQVEKVYPQAVSKLTDVVPDIYKQAEIKEGFIALENNLKAGEKVKIITQKGEEIVEVKEANFKGFKVENKTNGFVFVFGRQVSDFRSVDYEALSTLNISATQELLKRIEVLEKENTVLKSQMTAIEELKAEIAEMKNSNNKNLISKND